MTTSTTAVFIQVWDGDDELWSDIYPTLDATTLRLIKQELSKGYTVLISREQGDQ